MDVTIVVDALGPQLSGIGRYTWELCRKVPLEPNIGRVGYFANGTYLRGVDALLKALSRTRTRPFNRLWRHFNKRHLNGTLVHAPNYFLPREAETGIITVHDLSVFRHPETHPIDRIRAFEQHFENSLSRSLHVITDSETIRGELIVDFGLPENAVTSIPLGVAATFRPRVEAEINKQLAALGVLPGHYALCVSTFEPRKKVAELLRAWRELPVRIQNSNPLVLAGAEGWLNESLHEQIRDGVTAGWLKYLGFVPEDELAALYAGATLFLYPSIYEGFGLPPVEAMASGVPVIVANSSCLPEICGDAALYIDPDDIDGFSSAIAGALMDAEWRADARQRGLKRAARYQWQECVKRTVQIYRQCNSSGASD